MSRKWNYTVIVLETKEIKNGSIQGFSKYQAEKNIEKKFGFCNFLKLEEIKW